MEEQQLKDSGKRRSFDTGSVRDDATGKGRPSLMPVLALTQLSKHFEKGCAKYGDRNWEKGQPYSAYYDSATRHLMQWWGGADDEDHLTAFVWNAVCLLDTHLRVEQGVLGRNLNDRPPRLLSQGLSEQEEDAWRSLMTSQKESNTKPKQQTYTEKYWTGDKLYTDASGDMYDLGDMKGWRVLEVGEEIKRGDQYFRSGKEWDIASATIGYDVSIDNYPIRRKVES